MHFCSCLGLVECENILYAYFDATDPCFDAEGDSSKALVCCLVRGFDIIVAMNDYDSCICYFDPTDANCPTH